VEDLSAETRPLERGALSHVRVCDFGGQLAGAGATKLLAAFGAQVIRVEDPETRGQWDLLRRVGPFLDDRRGVDLGGGFNNHNVGKLGVTINLRTEEGRALLTRLLLECDVVTENFAAGVLEKLGFGYESLRSIRHDVIYVSNSGFGHTGPLRAFKTWGPIVQAVSGLTFSTGLPGSEPAGWGFSFMDHIAAYYMALAVLAALHERAVTGAGQWIDLASTAAGLAMLPTEILDATVNHRPGRRPDRPGGNRADFSQMCPHGVYPTEREDRWIAIACRDDRDWQALVGVLDERWARDPVLVTLAGRLAKEDELDARIQGWSASNSGDALELSLRSVGVPVSVVKSPKERIDEDPELRAWGMFPWVDHKEIGEVRVEGIPVRLSETDWSITDAAPCLGEHNDQVFGGLLGLGAAELDRLRREGVI
jgi:benzylsuccinate CoA-transferase BbsF subunit